MSFNLKERWTSIINFLASIGSNQIVADNEKVELSHDQMDKLNEKLATVDQLTADKEQLQSDLKAANQKAERFQSTLLDAAKALDPENEDHGSVDVVSAITELQSTLEEYAGQAGDVHTTTGKKKDKIDAGKTESWNDATVDYNIDADSSPLIPKE